MNWHHYCGLALLFSIYFGIYVDGATPKDDDGCPLMYRGNTSQSCGDGFCLCFTHFNTTFADCNNKSLNAVPKQLPRDTTYLDLSGNEITDLGKLPFENFQVLEVLNLSLNYITFIGNDTFGEMRNLVCLYLQGCNISKVDPGTFAGLKSLGYLDMSDNEDLTFKNLRNISNGLTSTKIKTLKLNKIHQKYGSCIDLTGNDMEFMNKTNITRLYIDSNRLSTVEIKVVDYMPLSLELLSAKNNMLMAAEYIFYLTSHPIINLRELIISDQGQTKFFDPITVWQKQGITNPKTNVLLPDVNACSINYVDFSNCNFKSVITKIILNKPNNLTHLIGSHNILWKWEGPCENFQNLTFLDLSSNYCEKVSSDFFHNMTNLVHLNVSMNFLCFSLETDKEGSIFKKQSKLENLDLSINKIRYLPEKVFVGLSGLRILNLSENSLLHLSVDFKHMHNLEIMNLSHNMLENIPKSVRDSFEQLTNFTINIQNNQFRCSCNATSTDFLFWMIHTKVQFENGTQITECVFENETHITFTNRADIQRVYDALMKECTSHLLLIFSFVLLAVLSLSFLLSTLIYRFRWNLRYFYYTAKFRYMGYRPVAGENIQYKADVFVSYADEDRQFVRQYLTEKLESERNLRLLLHDRDFLAGEFVGDNIVCAITESKKTLVVMTKNFLESQWCMYELNMARMESVQRGETVICVLLKEDIPAKIMPAEVLDVMKKQTYIEYPEDTHLMDTFWERLALSLSEA